MKRLVTVFFLAAISALPNSASAAPSGKVAGSHVHVRPHPYPKPHRVVTAPADEYFGRGRSSILGIRNTLHDLNIRYDGTVARTPFLYSRTAGLEDAMRDWQKKYRGDLWLAHYLFQLDQLYMRVPAKLGHAKVVSTSRWIVTAYPNTYYSRYLKHIASMRRPAAATPSPTPTPPSDATPTPSTEPTEQPTTAPTSAG